MITKDKEDIPLYQAGQSRINPSPLSREEHSRISSSRASNRESEFISENIMEIGGPPGPEPTRYGDWEKNGRCIDF
jgi:hypothetical protein